MAIKINKIICLTVISLALGACASHRKPEDEQNFKPYIADQQQNFTATYPKDSWAYPAGTPTKAIIARWDQASLIKAVRSGKGGTHVVVGPQFYNLSWSSQRGLIDAVAQMYNLTHFMLEDVNTKRVVGVYTPQGLQLN